MFTSHKNPLTLINTGSIKTRGVNPQADGAPVYGRRFTFAEGDGSYKTVVVQNRVTPVAHQDIIGVGATAFFTVSTVVFETTHHEPKYTGFNDTTVERTISKSYGVYDSPDGASWVAKQMLFDINPNQFA